MYIVYKLHILFITCQNYIYNTYIIYLFNFTYYYYMLWLHALPADRMSIIAYYYAILLSKLHYLLLPELYKHYVYYIFILFYILLLYVVIICLTCGSHDYYCLLLRNIAIQITLFVPCQNIYTLYIIYTYSISYIITICNEYMSYLRIAWLLLPIMYIT